MLLLLLLTLSLSLSPVLPTLRGRITLLNYRSIVVNALIYDLIATAEMLHDFDKSAVSMPTAATNANNINVNNNHSNTATSAAAMQMPTMSGIFMRDTDNCCHSNSNKNNNNSNSTSHTTIAADKHDAGAVHVFAARVTANRAATLAAATTVVAAAAAANCTTAINVHVENLENRKNQMAYRNMSTTASNTTTTNTIAITTTTPTTPTTLAAANTQQTTVIATTIPANPRAASQSQPATATTTTITTTTTAIAMPAMHSHDLLSPTNGATSSCATQMPELPTTQTQKQTQIQKFPSAAATATTSPAASSLSSSAAPPTRPTQVSTQQSAAAAAMPLQLQSPMARATPKPTTATTTTTAQALPTLQAHWQRILSRPKRYLAFPEGSSFSVAVCFTVGIVGNPRYNYMSYGLNWGVAYDLPNATWVLLNLHGLMRRPVPTAVLRRRTRRALYAQIEDTIDNMGYNGRDCVLRALCESRQYFSKTKMGMIGEMLRVVFSLPKQRILTRELEENSEIAAYDHAYRKARAVDCASHYDCTFSLLELAFGKYANPPPNYYEQFGM